MLEGCTSADRGVVELGERTELPGARGGDEGWGGGGRLGGAGDGSIGGSGGGGRSDCPLAGVSQSTAVQPRIEATSLRRRRIAWRV